MYRTKKAKSKRKTYFYGCAYFRQVRDSKLARGYYQKSVVIVSRRPFYGLLKRLVCLVAPHFFENGKGLLDQVFTDLSRWPHISPGHFDLAVMGNNLQVRIT
eukprot:Pgem_evm1s9305